jgi:hypothetical protein
MVRALKKHNQDGLRYTRPAQIERAIAEVLNEPPAAWLDRAKIVDKGNPKYLAPEVLVHLVRHALRMQDYPTANALLPCLGERCIRVLKRTVSVSAVFDADEVRDETVSRLYELFAEDPQSPDEGILDYYEIRFESAFATLRANVIREATARAAPLMPLTSTDGQEDAEGDEPIELQELASDSEAAVLSAENAELHRLIQALPPVECDAVTWKYVYGYKTESNDPGETTVATLCGVSGSEVRSRLRSAYARLKKWMEEKS